MATMTKEERQEAIAACKTLEDLQRLGAQLSYKPGWAAHIWAARTEKETQNG